MSTTTIRIDVDLKARIAKAANKSGTTAHAFIVDAIAQRVEQAEQALELERVAEQRWTKLLASGKSVAWKDARTYLQDRARGKSARKPTARKAGG